MDMVNQPKKEPDRAASPGKNMQKLPQEVPAGVENG